jgi:hypothetical protein
VVVVFQVVAVVLHRTTRGIVIPYADILRLIAAEVVVEVVCGIQSVIVVAAAVDSEVPAAWLASNFWGFVNLRKM